MIIPYQQIPEETLTALLEEFVTREGTDYGEVETSLADKVAGLRRQLKHGDIAIVFDPAMETTSLVPARDLQGFEGA
ncbi:YheU family protein [Gilvimarinus agarilyticus]|uniref:YheU family protein n=1 Tax=unclassified Gilvimarinus TaxID=2642066 RepID=UPI001C08F5E6|nr:MULTISPECIES: YheU family protein [unclassified Gilvimarinus]MBU2886801.1 YheU family protein [Gilvimarinus agarilyticus]MDO6571465.1 YheU family protein [Gilvimarinus sp. 2_MG-2023]MDO6747354.1 YheU family protein [Gilvimarinus sp. 1_MG-2023]